MNTVSNAWTAGWLSARALFHWLVPSAYLPSFIVGPALQVTFFGFVIAYSGREVAATVVGLVLANSAIAGLYGGLMVVSGDRWQATLEPVTQTRLSTGIRLLGRLVPIACHATLVSLVLLAGAAILGIVPSNPTVLGQIALLAVASAGAVSALGLLVGTLGLLMRDPFVWGSVLFLLLQVSSGALLPRNELPSPIRIMTSVAPLSHSVETAQATIRGQAGFPDTVTAVGWEAAVAMALMVVTTAAYRRLELVAARTGRLAFA